MKSAKNKKFNQHPVSSPCRVVWGLCDDPVCCAGCCGLHIPLRAGGASGPPGQPAARGRGAYSDQFVTGVNDVRNKNLKEYWPLVGGAAEPRAGAGRGDWPAAGRALHQPGGHLLPLPGRPGRHPPADGHHTPRVGDEYIIYTYYEMFYSTQC